MVAKKGSKAKKSSEKARDGGRRKASFADYLADEDGGTEEAKVDEDEDGLSPPGSSKNRKKNASKNKSGKAKPGFEITTRNDGFRSVVLHRGPPEGADTTDSFVEDSDDALNMDEDGGALQQAEAEDLEFAELETIVYGREKTVAQVLKIDGDSQKCQVRKFCHGGQLDRLLASQKEKASFIMHEKEVILTEFEEWVAFDEIVTNCVVYNAEDYFALFPGPGAASAAADFIGSPGKTSIAGSRPATPSSAVACGGRGRARTPAKKTPTRGAKVVRAASSANGSALRSTNWAAAIDTPLRKLLEDDDDDAPQEDELGVPDEHEYFCRRAYTECEGRRGFPDLRWEPTACASSFDTAVFTEQLRKRQAEAEVDLLGAEDEFIVDEIERAELQKMPKWFRVMKEARAALLPSVMPKNGTSCRDREKGEIKAFLERATKGESGTNVMFIAGLPGTGKTAMVNEILTQWEGKLGARRVVRCNCLKIFGTYSLYMDMYMHLSGEARRPLPRKALNLLQRQFEIFQQRKQPVILFLDELDALKQNLLYRVLEWTLFYDNLILLTISNTLNLPERLAPKVCSRLRPSRLPVEPYTYPQLKEIITSRLDKQVFGDNTIDLCAVRIAAEMGDVRKALQVCRSSLDYRINENKRICREEYIREQRAAAGSPKATAAQGGQDVVMGTEDDDEDIEVPALPELLSKWQTLLQRWCTRNKKKLPDVLKVSIVDMNYVEAKTLRSNPKLQMMENLAVNPRWFLAAVAAEFEGAVPPTEEITLLDAQEKMRSCIIQAAMWKDFSHSLVNVDNSGELTSRSATPFPYHNCRRYLEMLVQGGIVEHVDGLATSAGLRVATRIWNGRPRHAKGVYDLGALDVIRLASDIEVDDIRYALTRAKCPIGKYLLKLTFPED
ncbi:unnamed protein product [Amoebophrya sp. A25]|nr:unnamed protein product [Amoebophrya sp. A25]|eukprot:GSA25T00013557001.1